jgi:hypothetical protein
VSDQNIGKKMIEEAELAPFLEEYAAVTGQQLSVIGSGESPDFVCLRPNGTEVGIELVKVSNSPARPFDLDVFEFRDSLSAFISLQETIYEKEAKRLKPHWQLPDSTILVVQINDCESDSLIHHFQQDIFEELASTGFVEIWVADYTVAEAFNTVQLIGIKPESVRGLHRHRFHEMKPYG